MKKKEKNFRQTVRRPGGAGFGISPSKSHWQVVSVWFRITASGVDTDEGSASGSAEFATAFLGVFRFSISSVSIIFFYSLAK